MPIQADQDIERPHGDLKPSGISGWSQKLNPQPWEPGRGGCGGAGGRERGKKRNPQNSFRRTAVPKAGPPAPSGATAWEWSCPDTSMWLRSAHASAAQGSLKLVSHLQNVPELQANTLPFLPGSYSSQLRVQLALQSRQTPHKNELWYFWVKRGPAGMTGMMEEYGWEPSKD